MIQISDSAEALSPVMTHYCQYILHMNSNERELVLVSCCNIHTQSSQTSHNSDVRRSKLLSGSASCDLCKSPISILQKKAIGELYPVVPVSSCAFNVCGSYAHFNFCPYKLPLKKNVNALRLYCTDS